MNATFRKMLGYQEPEIHDVRLSDFTDDGDSGRNPFAELVKSGEGHVKIEKHHRRSDDSFIWVKASLLVMPRPPATTRFVIALVEDISEAKHAQSQAVDHERRRLAEELHNITGQNILALIMRLDRIKRDMEMPDPKVYATLSECADLARQSLREIRTFSYLLHPPLFDELGFVRAMRTFAQIFAERSEMRVDVDIPDSYREPAPRVPTAPHCLPHKKNAPAQQPPRAAETGPEKADPRPEEEARRRQAPGTGAGQRPPPHPVSQKSEAVAPADSSILVSG